MEEKAKLITNSQGESIRPSRLIDFIGQKELVECLTICVNAAKRRKECLDHVLLYGPPGLGKTSIGYTLAKEMDSKMRLISGPSLERPGDLAAILSDLSPGETLFIDEIHRLPSAVEEVLYSAMEDFCLYVVIGSGSDARSIEINIPPFTLIGATTKAGDLSSPLRSRFGIVYGMKYYSNDELTKIVIRAAKILEIGISEEAANEIAKRSRGTPRIANRFLRRARDFADSMGSSIIDLSISQKTFYCLGIDEYGLNPLDRRYLLGLIERFERRPTGLVSLSSYLGEDLLTLEEAVEPFLLRLGLIEKTPKGRLVTPKAASLLLAK